jgi:hypothetical protein
MRKAARILAIVLIGATGWLGLREFLSDPFDGETRLQQSVSFAVALYGILGVLGAVGMIRRRPWSTAVSIVWAVAIVYAASIASFAFHDPGLDKPGTWQGVAGAFVACALIGWYVVWAARESARPVAPAPERVA